MALNRTLKKAPKKSTPWIAIIAGGIAGIVVLGMIGLWLYMQFGFQIYENKKQGLVVPYPKGWSIVRVPVKDTVVAFASPKSGPADMQENFAITTVDMSKNPMNVEDLAKLTIDQTVTVVAGCRLVSAKPVTISGKKAYHIVFYLEGSGMRMVMAFYQFMFRDVVAYNMMYFGEVDLYEKRDRFMFDMVARMMKIYF